MKGWREDPDFLRVVGWSIVAGAAAIGAIIALLIILSHLPGDW